MICLYPCLCTCGVNAMFFKKHRYKRNQYPIGPCICLSNFSSLYSGSMVSRQMMMWSWPTIGTNPPLRRLRRRMAKCNRLPKGMLWVNGCMLKKMMVREKHTHPEIVLVESIMFVFNAIACYCMIFTICIFLQMKSWDGC